jgi:hypothetical protein
MVRGAVLWCVWLERNNISFQNTYVPSLKAVGSKIIALTSFWCKNLKNGSLLHLSLVLPLDTNDLYTQELLPLSEEEKVTLEDEREAQEGHEVYTLEDTTPMLRLIQNI